MDKSIGLKQSDVVTVQQGFSFVNSPTFRVSEVAVNLGKRLSEFKSDAQVTWSEKGVPCEVLRSDGQGWQKGKVRFSLEFIPDTEEGVEAKETKLLPPSEASPLDELRAELNLNK